MTRHSIRKHLLGSRNQARLLRFARPDQWTPEIFRPRSRVRGRMDALIDTGDLASSNKCSSSAPWRRKNQISTACSPPPRGPRPGVQAASAGTTQGASLLRSCARLFLTLLFATVFSLVGRSLVRPEVRADLIGCGTGGARSSSRIALRGRSKCSPRYFIRSWLRGPRPDRPRPSSRARAP